MKKFIITTALLCLVSTTSVFASTSIPVYFNSEPISLSQNPVVKDGATLVPFRGIFEALGYNVSYDSSTNTITGYNSNKKISFQIGSKTAYVNGTKKALPTAPQSLNGATMVPLRFVSEAAGHSVAWNDDTNYITIGKNNQDIIDIYENSSVVYIGGAGDLEFIRVEDLYDVNATGKYAGYKELLGHPFTGYSIYYKGNSSSYQSTVVKPYYNPNQKVTWKLDGRTYTSTKESVFELISSYSNLAGGIDTKNSEDLYDIFGSTYTEWFNRGFVAQEGGRLVEAYFGYLDGSKWQHYADMYNSDLAVEDASRIFQAQELAEEAAKQKEYDDYFAYEDKKSAALDQFTDQWISTDRLRGMGIYAVRVDNYITFLPSSSNDELFRMNNIPKLEEGVVNEVNGVRLQYLKETTVPFPEAKDGTGQLVIDVRSIVYSIPDLQAVGVLKKR